MPDDSLASFIESLEANHEFPGPYTIKVIGANSEQFADSVLAATQEELSLDEAPHHGVRATPSGRHVAITLDLQIAATDQLIVLYQRLKTIDDVAFLI